MPNSLTHPVRVVILEDHLTIIDGYRYRLTASAGFEIVGVASYGEDLEPLLVRANADLVIMDVTVPTSANNPNPYPILSYLPHLHQRWPNLTLLVISMHAESALIRAAMRAGASGYILKEDQASLADLPAITRAVLAGNIFLSPQAEQQWRKRHAEAGAPLTPRQLEALSLCAAYPDLSTQALAERLSVAASSFRNLLSGAYLRLNVSTRAGAVAEARRRGLITPLPTPSL